MKKGLSFLLLSILAASLTPTPSAKAALPRGFQQRLHAQGLSTPTSMTWEPDGRLLYVTEKSGNLRVVRDGRLISSPVFRASVSTGSERGLLGVALDPHFATTRFVFLYYTRSSAPVKNRVSRIRLQPGNLRAVPNSEVVLLDNIPSDAGNHNGGAIHFDKTGHLLIATGDGGSTPANSQSLTTLAGKLLRISRTGGIPTNNPFYGDGGGVRGEIWAYGLRNPYTFAVSNAGVIYINDVGASSREEINRGGAGGNYGWPTCEGVCSQPGLRNPMYQYPRSHGRAITGGDFYESNRFPTDYRGNYFFSDYTSNWIRRFRPNGTATGFHTTAPSPIDIDAGPDGHLYYLSIGQGRVYRLSY